MDEQVGSAAAGEGRLVRTRRARRLRIAVASTVTVAVLLAAGLLTVRWYRATQVAPPPYVVVIGESVLDDGTTSAGAIAVIERTDGTLTVRPVDSGETRSIPGTSFDRLRDALAMGGPGLVSSLVARDIDGGKEPAWLLLEREGWAGVVESAGGATVSLEESTTAFTGDELYRFSAGTSTLSGDEAAALLLAADSLEDGQEASAVRMDLAAILGTAVIERPEDVVSALDEGLGEYSGRVDQLRAFLR